MLDRILVVNGWSAPSRYSMALGIFVLTLGLRLWLFPADSGLPFLTFYPGLTVSLLICGMGPGVLVGVLSALSAYFFFFPPYWTFHYNAEGLLACAIFLLCAVILMMITRSLHNASQRLQRTAVELRVSEQRYRAVLEDQSDVICRYLTDGTLLYVNDAFCRLVNRPRESLVGNKWNPIAAPEDLPAIEHQLAQLSPSNPIVTIENRIRTSDGCMRWVQFINRAFFDETGHILETQSVGRDITERKQLEEQLVASAREVEDLYDLAPCGYHSLGSDGTYLRINATELAWIGCQRDEVVGKMKPSDFFTEGGRIQFEKQFADFLRSGRVTGLEYDLVGRNGRTRRVSISATAVRDEVGQFKMSRGVMFDVTDRHCALEATRSMAEQLELRVAQRTEQLHALASELEAAENRERRQIARDLHDDLGQILAAARVRLAGLCDDRRDDVRVSANAVAALIDRANASTRSLAAQLAPAVLYELGLSPALEALCEEIGRTFDLDVTVHDDGEPKPLSQEARSILYRATRELVINVAKHARTDSATIEIARADDKIVVRVSDAGVGYEPASAARRGLGLVSVRERLSFIGGTAEVRSVPGDGTVAVLTAPLLKYDVPAAERTA